MEKSFIKDLQPGDFVQTSFLASRIERRLSRDGEPYLQILLEDRTGTVQARVWHDVDAVEARFEADDFVVIRGEVEAFADRTFLTVQDLERLEDESVDMTDYFDASRWDPESLFQQLTELVETHVHTPAVLMFIRTLFADTDRMKTFKQAPAAMKNHHAYRSGLLEHCLSMCRLSLRICGHYDAYYPGMINSSLVVAGCILHDIGKCEELDFRRKTRYSTSGRLVGHIPTGAAWVDQYAAQCEETLAPDLILQLKHLVLSHHGKLEYGSPITPKTPEALVLHEVDMIDSRLNMCWNLRASDHNQEAWSEYSRALDGPMFFRGPSTWESPRRYDLQDLTGPGSVHADAADSLNGPQNLDLFGNHKS